MSRRAPAESALPGWLKIPELPEAPRSAPSGSTLTTLTPETRPYWSGLLVFALSVWTLAPTVHWLDGGLLTSASLELVNAHPPGAPGYVLLGRLASLLPLGTIALRVNLLSAFCTGLAAFFWCQLMIGLAALPLHARANARTRRAARVWPVLLTLAPFLLYAVWIQAVRAEVYAPQLLLQVAWIWSLERAGLLARPEGGSLEPGFLALSGFFLGLQLALHPLLAGLAALPVAAMVLSGGAGAWRTRPRWLVLPLLAGLPGLSIYLLVPLRAAGESGLAWGDATTASGFLDIVLARTFQQNFSSQSGAGLLDHLLLVGEALSPSLRPLTPILLLAPLLWLPLSPELARPEQRPTVLELRRFALLCLGLVAANLWTLLPQNKLMLDNPDLHGYLAVSHLLLWGLSGALLAGIARLPGDRFPRLPQLYCLLMGLLLLVNFIPAYPASQRGGDWLARVHGQAALQRLPTGGTLIASGNDTMFILRYLQEGEGRRPDVRVLARPLLTHAWYLDRLPATPAWLPEARGTVQALLPQAGPRAVRVELRLQDLAAAATLCPVPAPGWGFYDPGPCPLLDGPEPPLSQGLSTLRAARRGPQALTVGLNARAYLLDYYEARGRPDLAEAERARLVRDFPWFHLP